MQRTTLAFTFFFVALIAAGAPLAADQGAPAHPLAHSPLHIDRLELHWEFLQEDAAPPADVEAFRRTLLQAERFFRDHSLPAPEAERLEALKRAVHRALARRDSASLEQRAPAEKKAPVTVPASKATPLPLQGADTCEDAPLVSLGSYLGTTAGSSRDGTASCAPLGAAGDVWYRVPVAAGEKLFASTAGSSFDTVLSVHSTCPPPPNFGTNAELACDDDGGPGQTSALVVGEAFSATEYLVRVSGALLEAGDYRLTVESGGRIEGRVLGEAGEPLAGIEIEVWADGSGSFAFAVTGADGRFVVADLAADSYRLAAKSFGAYRDELYNDVPCSADDLCDFDGGDPIAVALGETVQLEDIRLRLGATVAGRVFERSTGAPPLTAAVSLLHVESFTHYSSFTVGDGTFRFEGLPAGQYRAFVETFGDYVDQAWNGIDCTTFCDFDDGTAFSVQLGESREDIDFALARLGRVSGRVTGPDGQPLSGQSVSLFDLDLSEVVTTYSSDGDYEMSAVRPGRYFAVAADDPFGFFVPELYREIPCTETSSGDCDFDLGTPFDVELESATDGIDFTLSAGGRITGRVTDGTSGEPLAALLVRVHSVGGGFVRESFTLQDGTYSVFGLPGGDYRVQVLYYGEEYLGMLYPDVVCVDSCPFDEAPPVTVTFEEELSGIDLALPRTGSIEGRITDASSGLPLAVISVLGTDGTHFVFVASDADGRYRLGGLRPSTYTLEVDSADYLHSQRSVTVALGENVEGVDFALDEGGRISGRVENRSGSGQIADVRIYDEDDQVVAVAFPDSDGFYVTQGLAAGDYRVLAVPLAFDELVPQLWPGINCPPEDPRLCDGGQAVAVELGQTTTDIDFQLDRFAYIPGSLRIAGTGEQVEGIVEMYDGAGVLLQSTATFAGIFDFRRVVPGEYYFIARPFDTVAGYMDQVAGGASCIGATCDPLSGTPVIVDWNATESPTFELERGGSLSGRLMDRDGQALEDTALVVDLYDEGGNFLDTTGTSSGRWFFRALPGADYRLVARDLTFMEYYDQVWPDGSCAEGGCQPSSGQTITVAGGQDVGGVAFAIDPVEPTSGRALTAEGAFPIAGATVQQWSSDGVLIRQTQTEADGRFSLRFRIPSYLSISSDRFQDTVWPDVACPNGDCRAVLGDGELITPQPGLVIDDIDFSLESTSDCGSATELCTLDNRFRTTVRWQTDDAQGEGGAVPLTDEAGYFWFFDPANVEVVLKTLDACDGFGHFWVFLAGLTNVEVEVTVLDTFTGASNVYRHEPGPLFQPIFDTVAFETCSATSPASDEIGRVPSAERSIGPAQAGVVPGKTRPEKTCVSSDEAACLTGERFRVEATFDTDGHGSGQAKAVPLTSDTAYFWFFDPENIEVVLKVLDACDGFDRHWVFAAGLTNVEVHITVTDTETGAVWTYDNVLGEDFRPVADTSTLLCP